VGSGTLNCWPTRRAFGGVFDFWPKIPVTGCDGVPHYRTIWVRSGHLAATAIVPPSAGKAVALMAKAL